MIRQPSLSPSLKLALKRLSNLDQCITYQTKIAGETITIMAKNNNTSKVMTSLRPTFIRFSDEKEGYTLEGSLVERRISEGRDGAMIKYTMQTEALGRVAFNAPYVVAEALEGMAMGTYVSIKYLGKVKGQNSRQFMDFEVLAAVDSDKVPSNVDDETGEIDPE